MWPRPCNAPYALPQFPVSRPKLIILLPNYRSSLLLDEAWDTRAIRFWGTASRQASLREVTRGPKRLRIMAAMPLACATCLVSRGVFSGAVVGVGVWGTRLGIFSCWFCVGAIRQREGSVERPASAWCN